LDRTTGTDLASLGAPTVSFLFDSTSGEVVTFAEVAFEAPPAGQVIGIIYSVAGTPTFFYDGSETFKVVAQGTPPVKYLAGDITSIQDNDVLTSAQSASDQPALNVNQDDGTIEHATTFVAGGTLLRRSPNFPKQIQGDSDYSLVLNTNVRVPV
jgi:hypothetical protein